MLPSGKVSAVTTHAADLILTGGSVYTVDPARSWAQALAVRGDRIVAVGTEADVGDLKGPATDVVDLRGRMVLPGFQDAHAHPAFAARNLLQLNLDHLGTRAEYLDAIGAYAAAHPDLPWITGGGWAITGFPPDGLPIKADLDAVVPDRPVYLMNVDVHSAWVNTKALEMAGWDRLTPDPWDGRLQRDADGDPTGALIEGAAYTFLDRFVPPTSPEVWRECLLLAQRELHALGITGWQDAWVRPELLQAYRELDDARELTMRVVTALWWDRHRGIEQVDDLLAMREGTGERERLHAGTVKIMLDGCPESCTAAMQSPYDGVFGDTYGCGMAFIEAEPLQQAVGALDAEGFQIHQHALGDRAVTMALDALEFARRANGPNDARHHLAHIQTPNPADLPRLRPLGVVANIQPLWACYDDAMSEITVPRIGEERFDRMYPLGDIRASGAAMAFGSDWPVSTPNVFQEIEVAVTRQPPWARDTPVWSPEQRIDLAAAIAGFTQGSAYVNHDDDGGSLEVGKRADLVVVDRNLFDRVSGYIGDAHAEMTLAKGRVVHRAPDV
ncbi:MAG: hypothetical protein QOI81_2212 [Actinomycetota bacterium]|nr:hypothetical protein [Actinomycetota bacterium]